MEGLFMRKLWKKQLPAAVLALIMMISLVPLAGAEEDHQHSYATSWSSSSTEHWHECTVSGCTATSERGAHNESAWRQKDTSSHEKVCTVCGYTMETKTHNYPSAPSSTKPATCYQYGEDRYKCQDCGYEDVRPISPTNNHQPSSGWSYDTSYHWHPCTTSGCPNKTGNAAHIFPANTYTSSTTQHWQICSTCGGASVKSNHIDNNGDGACDVCKQNMPQNRFTVTFQTPAGSSVIPNQTVLAGQRPSAVSNPSSFTSGGITYTFYGWMQGTSSNYVYTNQQTVNPANVAITGNTTFTALYRTNGYTVTFQSLSSSGNIAVSNQTVQNNGYPYNPSDPSKVTFGGVTYTFKGWTTSYTGSSWYLYTNQPLVTPSYQRINSNATFYAVYTTNDKSTISYTAAAGKETDFDARDFYNAYRNQYNGTLNYVTFNVAKSTYNSFEGAVYAGNSSLSHSDLTDSRFYYDEDDAGRNDYALDDLSLVADKNADDDSITLTFTAYGTWGQMSGTVRLAVGDATVDGKTIVYRVTPGKTVDFDRANFNTVFQASYPSESLEYVIFDRPDSDAFDHGTLYSEYGRSSYETAFTRSDLDDATFYYSNSVSGRDNYALNDLTLAAKNTFQDTVKLSFTAYGANSSHRVYGTVELRSSENASDGDITYKVSPGKSVDFDRSDFLSFLRDTYRNADLDYVIFDRPASANDYAQGTLYSGYGTSSQTSFSRSDLDNAAFYYNSKDATGRNDYALDSLTFVASSSFKTPIELTFTAYDEDGYDVDGTLVIQTDGSTSNYVGSVRYSTTTGTNVQINANDIARYFKKSTGGTLNYVMFTGVPSTGALYYNYYSASKYGSTGRTQLTSSNSNAFYFNPTSTAQYALTELTYVPSGSNYCVTIPFTAYGTNGVNVSGSLLISVSRSAVSEIYGVTSRNTAVSFPASGFYSAVLNATGSSLYSIQLLSLPASNQGTVYVGSGTSTRANTTTQYTYASGSNSISQLRFVPASTYTGSVEIPYVALNSNGQALASGTFSLGVVNTRRTFSDVGSSSWCYKYVTELSDAGVIDGYSNGAFKPDSTISYGAALKLVMLAAGYPEQAPTNSSSVFSGYLAKAQADGLVTRGNVNLSAPITRLQVAQLAAGALKLSTANLSSVKPFTDTSDLYVQALNAAGIVEGYFSNGTSTFRPNNTLTRGQVSAIVWRMQNYQK